MSSSWFNLQKDAFGVLDLAARLSFRTESSLSFSLERHSKSLLPTRQIGWVDLHYPCDGHIKLQTRISLPSEYHTPDNFRELVKRAISAAGIPPDATYEAVLFGAGGAMKIEQPVSREGLTDRLSG